MHILFYQKQLHGEHDFLALFMCHIKKKKKNRVHPMSGEYCSTIVNYMASFCHFKIQI